MYNNIFSGIATVVGILLVFATILCLLMLLGLLIFSVVSTWKMYVKANEPGWASIVPVYNKIILFKIIGYKWYYIFLLLLGCIPIVGYLALMLFNIHYNIKLAKSFGQSTGFGIGLCLLPIVFIPMIAFRSDIDYVAPAVNGEIDFNDLF